MRILHAAQRARPFRARQAGRRHRDRPTRRVLAHQARGSAVQAELQISNILGVARHSGVQRLQRITYGALAAPLYGEDRSLKAAVRIHRSPRLPDWSPARGAAPPAVPAPCPG